MALLPGINISQHVAFYIDRKRFLCQVTLPQCLHLLQSYPGALYFLLLAELVLHHFISWLPLLLFQQTTEPGAQPIIRYHFESPELIHQPAAAFDILEKRGQSQFRD